MSVPNMKSRSVMQHNFAMNPAADVPRSQFDLSHGKKVPFNFSDIIPILCRPVLPGDTWNCNISVAARTAVPVKPIMDTWTLEFFSFFVPMRILWNNAYKFWGEQDSPGDSTAFTIPTVTSPVGGFTVGSLADYFGIPTVGQIGGANTITINALPFRGYLTIYNEWFRDENLQNWQGAARPGCYGDGPDTVGNFTIKQRGKRFDYITQALPWPQKGNTAVALPLGTSAPVIGVAGQAIGFLDGGGGARNINTTNAATTLALSANASGSGGLRLSTVAAQTNMIADLTGATGTTLNAFRTAVAMQQYLEKDARGGTRYNEYVYTHFKVRTQDARLNRPEFIGGGYAPIETTAVPQTSATGLTGGTTPQGDLTASGYTQGRAGFTYSATEHGYIYTLVAARSDITYSQGLERMWTVSTRLDFPVPLLANLGEQALLNKEVYCVGTPAQDDAVFGYVPRFDEYRFIPSGICGILKPSAAGNIAYWHTSQLFGSLPTLNTTFITDDTKTVVQRNFAAGAATLGQQIFGEFYFNIKCARALPLYGIPGLTRL